MANLARVLSFSLALYLVAWLTICEVDAQVTFSRDWNPGKRMLENTEVHNTMKSASAICHLLLNQIRQLSACEGRTDELDLSNRP